MEFALRVDVGRLGDVLTQLSFGKEVEDFELCAAWTIGYLGDRDTLPEPYRELVESPRSRKPLGEFVFSEWNKPAPLGHSEEAVEVRLISLPNHAHENLKTAGSYLLVDLIATKDRRGPRPQGMSSCCRDLQVGPAMPIEK